MTPKIPQGWRKLREGTRVKNGDRVKLSSPCWYQWPWVKVRGIVSMKMTVIRRIPSLPRQGFSGLTKKEKKIVRSKKNFDQLVEWARLHNKR